MDSKYYCPLMEEVIDYGVCFDIHMRVEGCGPDWLVPKKAIEKENFKEICLKCEHHHDD